MRIVSHLTYPVVFSSYYEVYVGHYIFLVPNEIILKFRAHALDDRPNDGRKAKCVPPRGAARYVAVVQRERKETEDETTHADRCYPVHNG